jgi:hypothetical protein
MNRITWLASYPKSGNTWFRIFLTNLLNEEDGPADINDLEKTPIASARGIFDDVMGLEASDLDADEIDHLRPDLYLNLAENADSPLYMKIHDAWTTLPDNRPLIPRDATDRALYFVRNPLDVAVSFAHHNGWDYDRSIEKMADDSFTFCGNPKRLHNQLRQKVLSWSGHVESWTDGPSFPVHVMRYEDMKTSPLETFTKAVSFMGLPHSSDQIEKALAHSAFDVVRKQEEQDGFKEKSPASARFFRKGQTGSWRAELNETQAERIVSDHFAVMRRFGYLDENGGIVY